MPEAPPAFAERALDAMRAAGAPLCLGIDPRMQEVPPALAPEAVPEDAPVAERLAPLAAFARALLEIAASEGVPLVKPQVAFFEAFGAAGMALLEDLLARARDLGLLTIADAKRGDIGSTAEAYARAWLGAGAPLQADALTVNPYLGADALEPFVAAAARAGAGLFVLVRTSNPGAAAFQEAGGAGPAGIATRVAQWIAERSEALVGPSGYGPIGAVIGATVPEAAARLRGVLGRSLILAPGVGAQGARPEDLGPFLDARGEGVVVPVSRAIAGAWREAPASVAWEDAVRARIRDLKACLATS